MLYDLTEEEFARLSIAKSEQTQSRLNLYSAAMRALYSRLLPDLSGAELKVLVYLVGATLGEGQLAKEITLGEFSSGYKNANGGAVNTGTGLSRTALQAALKGLLGKGLMVAYRALNQNGWEASSRVYEINFKTFFGESSPLGGPNSGPGGPSNWTPLHIENIVLSGQGMRDTSISFLRGSAVAAETGARRRRVAMIGKKKEARVKPSYKNAEDAIASITNRHVETARSLATSATGKPAHEMTRPEMQALFDEQATKAAVGYRLMVTSREYGFLKKRMKDNPPGDFAELVRWSLTYWPTLSAQNATAVRKDRGRLVAGKRLPPAQHFQTFAYWYPYFLRAHQNHLATQGQPAAKAEKDLEKERLRRRAEKAERDVELLRKRQAQAPAHDPFKLAATARTRRAKPVDLAAPVEFKEWPGHKD